MNAESFEDNQEPRGWKYTYEVEETHLPYVFRLSEDKIYSSIHFDEGKFKHPQNKEEDIDPVDFVEDLKNEFSVSEIILSCCYPDKAREVLGDMDGVELIGSGDSEVRTVFNNVKNEIRVESC